MAEYIVNIEMEAYDQMVADGILKVSETHTLYGMPVREEIIRCRDCKHKDDWLDSGGQCGVDPNGFCAWAERRDAE